MSKLDISVPHNLSQEDAQKRIKTLLAGLQQEHKDTIQDVSEHWDGNEGAFSFKAKGFNIAGKISVEKDKVKLEGELPMFLSFLKGTISGMISERARKILS